MTIDEMTKHINKLGLKKRYVPIYDFESENIELKQRKPAHIVEGWLKGTQMVIHADGVQVWTPHSRLARSIVDEAHIPSHLFRPLDGECELIVPFDIADTYLHKLGAKVRKTLLPPTPNQLKNRFKKGQINR